MHLFALNIPELLLALWRGTFKCDSDDDKKTWDWAVLKNRVWTQHGQAVADATPYIPGSFDRPPRNPAEKINSSYKAWEFLMYLVVLGPAVFYGVLPDKYWQHYCKLAYAIQVLCQHVVTKSQLESAYKAILEFTIEFEQLYYQRKLSRLHMVRPCLHTLLHTIREVLRKGPLPCSSQWTMERLIGSLGGEVRQPSNPFANLSRRGLARCQNNALQSMAPYLSRQGNKVPHGAAPFGGGYALLRA
ncbi:hypothetical protein NEOLEDRAFT_1035852, partial [Neolentinus lepideus HHB14362 ss-1]